MSDLRNILIERMVGDMSKILTFKNMGKSPDELTKLTMPKIDEAGADIRALLLNLIEQAKEKDLPLTWLTGEIKKL